MSLVVGGAVASALTLAVFFHPWIALGLVIDAALLWAALGTGVDARDSEPMTTPRADLRNEH